MQAYYEIVHYDIIIIQILLHPIMFIFVFMYVDKTYYVLI